MTSQLFSRHIAIALLVSAAITAPIGCTRPTETHLTGFVNPFLGTATLWDEADLGYERHQQSRTWGAEVFPGAALPCAMVQLTPQTMYHAGAGYQYEDSTILGFAHSAMGHWNLMELPILPVTGNVTADDFASTFSHKHESARPGYYQVFLDRYNVNVELSSTLRAGFHRYTFRPADAKRLLVNVAHAQNPVHRWSIDKVSDNAFAGNQGGMFFYAVTSADIDSIAILQSEVENGTPVAIVDFKDNIKSDPLEVKVGVSYVGIDNARENLEAEMLTKDFATVCREADDTWQTLLSKIKVQGATERHHRLLYTTLYRASLMPRLESDVNGQYRDARGETACDSGYRYYSNPAFWDVHRNQLPLLAMLQPDVARDVIRSTIDRGEKRHGYIPTYFHGDHAPTFVIGSYKRGVTDFDLSRAYALALKSATVPGGRDSRPYLDEYLANGYITDENIPDCPFYEEHKGGVTKTLEYAYDDYAVAQMARELNDTAMYARLMRRSDNYKNVFDTSTGFMRGRVDNGAWMTPFDSYYPYFQHMYREANAWNQIFYAPHDPEGIIALYPSAEAVDAKLDSLFTEPYIGLEVSNLTGFIGNYCHGNQPGHNIPYTYYFIDRQEKSQAILDSIMNRFYDMGPERLAYCGMDDAGEMSAWYVLNAIGLYTYSPADAEYLVTVPLFDRVTIELPQGPFTIIRKGSGRRITGITHGDTPISSYFISHDLLTQGKTLTIAVTE